MTDRPEKRKKRQIGIRFECQRGCTKCCSIPGIVYVQAREIPKMAEFFKMTPEQFTEKHLRQHWADIFLLDFPDDEPCVFLEETGCAIYPVRPAQCSTFPFWPENVNNPDNWNKLHKFCPGIGVGRLHTIDEIIDTMADVSYGPFL